MNLLIAGNAYISTSHHGFADQLGDMIMRSAVYHGVGAAMRGHGLVTTLLIGAALVGIGYILRRA